MGHAITLEVTFVARRGRCPDDATPVEGVVRMPDDSLHPFCGWIDLLGLLEPLAAGAGHPVEEHS